MKTYTNKVFHTQYSDILRLQVKSILTLFVEECADPFYIFQVFSCVLWLIDEYYYYAIAIVVVSLGSIVISIFQTRKHLQTLRAMIAKSGDVNVLMPGGNIEQVYRRRTCLSNFYSYAYAY